MSNLTSIKPYSRSIDKNAGRKLMYTCFQLK